MKPAYIQFISDILTQAAKVAAENYGLASSTTKSGDNNQVLTDTDLAIGKLIVAAVQDNYPEHNVIDEEAGVIDLHSEYTWVIDPIDGTSNFAAGVPTYGVMVGLLQGGRAVAGGIALPSLGEVYLGGKETPATLNGTSINVSAETNLLSGLVAYGIDGHQENPELTHSEAKKLADIVLAVRNLRTSNSCFDAVMVARGSYGAGLNRTSKIWDNVAQQAVIEAAGGTYTDFFGQPIDYSNPIARATQNFTWCCGAPELHRQLQAIIHR